MKTQTLMTRFSIVLMLIFTSSLFAQKHYIGVKIGPNFSNYKPGNANNFATGLIVGATYSYQFANGFTVGADALYLQQGYKINLFGNHRQTFDYIAIPLKVGYTYGPSWQVFGNVGLVPSFLAGARLRTKVLNTNNVSSNYDSFQKFDLGLLLELGGGYTINEKFNVFASLGFQYFFIPNVESNADYSDRAKNLSIPLTVGFRYVF